MKAAIALAILLFDLATAVVGKRIFDRQAAPSSTSSVFSVPTPVVPQVQTVNGSSHDLSQHFCRIWRHQSVYADGKIYVDGGNTYVPRGNATYNTVATNQYDQGINGVLLVLDLSRNFTNQDSSVYSVIHKGPQVPNGLIEATLWYSKVTRKIYQLGGWFSFNNNTDPGFTPDAQIPSSSIWEFDIDLQSWAKSAFKYINTGSKLDRPGAAANCDAPTLNKSFLFEGFVQQRSDPAYGNYTIASMYKFLEGMLTLDTNTSPPTLTNVSVPAYIGPRMNGAMIHVPVGKQGIIVNIGGQVPMSTVSLPFGVPVVDANAKGTNIVNSFVDIYDIETGFWFRQTTFGVPEIPLGRSDICTILVTASDNSSYNIFMIAGVQTYNGVIAFEDMWVLTLPTFQWVKVHTRPGGIYGHTCHAVGENLLIIGGMQTTDAGGNVKNCSTHMPAEIFSLTKMEYTGVFDAEGATRAPPVPADVVTLIGGTALGGAVVTKPNLWSDLYLQYIFTPNVARPPYTPSYKLANETSTTTNSTTTTPSTNPTTSDKPLPSHIGPIAGGVVGGVVVLAILLTIIFICLKRRRKAASQSNMPPPEFSGAELPTYKDSEYRDKNAVEVSSFNNPLVFAPYHPAPNSGPIEMDAEEAQDEWRPLNVAPGAQNNNPGMHSPSRFSAVSVASSAESGGPISPGLPPTPGDGPNGGRRSRQSEVSRDST